MHKKIKCPNNIFVLDIKFSKYTPPHEFQNSDLGPVVYCF